MPWIVPPKATSERAPKCSPPPVAQQVAAVFSIDVSFRQARRVLPALPQDASVRLLTPVFDLVASRQCSGRALPFSLPLGRPVPALLLKPAAARVQVQCLASVPLRQFSRLIRPFSFSVCEFESSRRSEIDPEDSTKSPPVLASGAHRRSKQQCTQRREPFRANALGKSSAPSQEGQLTAARYIAGERGRLARCVTCRAGHFWERAAVGAPRSPRAG